MSNQVDASKIKVVEVQEVLNRIELIEKRYADAINRPLVDITKEIVIAIEQIAAEARLSELYNLIGQDMPDYPMYVARFSSIEDKSTGD